MIEQAALELCQTKPVSTQVRPRDITEKAIRLLNRLSMEDIVDVKETLLSILYIVLLTT